MRKRALIGPADWLRLCHELGLVGRDKQQLLLMLGLRLDRPVTAMEPSPEPMPVQPPIISTGPLTLEPTLPDQPSPVAFERNSQTGAERNLSWIEEVRPPLSFPSNVGKANPMPVASWCRPTKSDLDPLFTRRLERTILIAALARERQTRELDLAELVRRTGRMNFHHRLPYLERKTLRLGCQVIFDQSEIMELFVEDQTRLIAHVGAIVPEGRLTVVSTTFGTPDDDAWSLPDPGQPVLALSDLGTTPTFVALAQRGPQAWLDFATRLRDRSSDLIVFFTGRFGALPSGLRRLALIVPWNHNARTGTVDRRRREQLNR